MYYICSAVIGDMRSHLMIFTLVVFIGACAPAPANHVAGSPLPLAANPPTSAVPTETTQGTTPLPATETIASSPLPPLPTVPDHQAFTEYRNGTLWVRLFYPQDEAVVQTAQISVTGQAPVDTVVSVNNEVYVVSADQFFNIPIELEEGPNVLEFVASDLAGNEVSFILTVTYEP